MTNSFAIHSNERSLQNTISSDSSSYSTSSGTNNVPSPDNSLSGPSSRPTRPTLSITSHTGDTVQSCADLALSRSTDPIYSNSKFSLSSLSFARQVNATQNSNPHILPYELWENDSDAPDCHSCQKSFSLWVRRHHCRRCGLVYCDQCSSSRADLLEYSFRIDPLGASLRDDVPPTSQRVCKACHTIIRAGTRIPPVEVPVPMKRTDSQSSVLTECPVCAIRLYTIGSTKDQHESHINSCLEGGNSFDGARNSSRYLVFTLSSDSPLVNQECIICMEDYKEGDRIARLNCLCCFHRGCIQEWFFQNTNCPVHFQ